MDVSGNVRRNGTPVQMYVCASSHFFCLCDFQLFFFGLDGTATAVQLNDGISLEAPRGFNLQARTSAWMLAGVRFAFRFAFLKEAQCGYGFSSGRIRQWRQVEDLAMH